MNSPAYDIAKILEAYGESSGSGLEFATNLFVAKEPAKPINCVTIFDYPGFPPALGLTDQGYEYPSIQIRVRNVGYMAGWEIAENIKTILHGLRTTVNDTLYTNIYCSSGPALLDQDDNGNFRIIINFNLQRRAV